MGQIGGADRPLPVLVAAASGYGVGGVSVREGAVVRRAPLFSVLGGDVAPALSMEALRLAQGARNYVMRTTGASNEIGPGGAPVLMDVRNGDISIPIAADGGFWIRFAGPQPARFLSAWRILDGRGADPSLADQIAGHIVLVAATAPGLSRPVDTPLGPGAQPVEIHAEIIEQTLVGLFLQRPDWAHGAEAVAVAAVGVFTAFATIGRSALTGLVLGGVVPTVVLVGSWLAFTRGQLLLSPVTPILSGAVLYTILTSVNYFRSRRESGAVRAQFERFVAPEVIRKLVADPDRADAMSGEGRDLTVLFCDARGFTAMSETMPPEALIAYLNACFGELTEAVLEAGGTIDKYMGDCIMAFWNAPLPVPDHPARALRACFAIRAAQDRLNARFVREGQPPANFGVGLNTGMCSVGLMGSPRRLDYSCVGDTVNVASRLQDLTKHYGVWNIVGAATAAAAPGWQFAPLGRAPIRNRAGAVEVVTVLGPPGAPLSPSLSDAQTLLKVIEAETAAGRYPDAALSSLAAIDTPGFNGAQTARALQPVLRAMVTSP
jgi:adenylate cyclase